MAGGGLQNDACGRIILITYFCLLAVGFSNNNYNNRFNQLL